MRSVTGGLAIACLFGGKTNVGKTMLITTNITATTKRILYLSKCYNKTVREREELPAGVSMQEDEAAQLFGRCHPFVAEPEGADESIAKLRYRARCDDGANQVRV